MRIDWSQRAIADLEALHDYIARDSPIYAGRFVTRIVRATEPLADFPELGRRVLEEPEQENLRELVVQFYRVIYRIETERILIATLLHGSRDVEHLPEKPWRRP